MNCLGYNLANQLVETNVVFEDNLNNCIINLLCGSII